jgi:CheY-like chemotaxis protein
MMSILQVEDDPNDVLFLQRALLKAGVANPIQSVSDGQQAIDYLQGAGPFADRAKFPFPGLVLLDLKLPYVMGLGVLRWIREQLRAPLVVIILTASAENADIAAAYQSGANGFLVKPSEASKLLDMVKALKDFWLTHNTLPAGSYREPQSAPPPSGTAAPGADSARLAGDAPPPGPTAEAAGQPTPFWGAAFFESHLKSAPHTLSLFARDTDAETDD